MDDLKVPYVNHILLPLQNFEVLSVNFLSIKSGKIKQKERERITFSL